MFHKLWLLTQALLTLLWAHAALRLVPFSSLCGSAPDRPAGGGRLRPPSWVSPALLARAITAAARFIPRSTCLVRALAAQRLLVRYGYSSNLHIGVANPAASGFEAHAWVECDGAVLIGVTATEYTPLLNWSVAP